MLRFNFFVNEARSQEAYLLTLMQEDAAAGIPGFCRTMVKDAEGIYQVTELSRERPSGRLLCRQAVEAENIDAATKIAVSFFRAHAAHLELREVPLSKL